MPWVPPFLERLGLGLEAEARDVRRAYARELRRIDQETDPRGFQALREAYEAALQWVERPPDEDEPEGDDERHEDDEAEGRGADGAGAQDGEGAPPRDEDGPPRFTWREAAWAARTRTIEPAPDPEEPPSAPGAFDDPAPAAGWSRDRVPSDAPPLAAPAPPELLARAVFDELYASAGRWSYENDARDALERAFADPRLAGLEQRVELEALVAARLADGWRPGHEHLFAAALEWFEWRHDGRRLGQLGSAGAAIDPVIEEAVVLRGLEEHEQYQRVARWLRLGTRPPDDTLEALGPAFELLRARFPGWLRAMAPAEGVTRWAAALAQLPKAPPRPEVKPEASGGNRWGVLVAVIVIMGVFRMCSGALSSSERRHGPERLRIPSQASGLPEGLGSPESLEKLMASVRAWQECQEGKAQACVVAGFAHLHGKDGVPADPALAAELFRKACTLASGEGCLELAHLLRGGRGVTQDAASALAYYARACDQGLAAGCAAVAKLRPGPPERAERPDEQKRPARSAGAGKPKRSAGPSVDRTDEWMKMEQVRAGDLVRMACDGGDPTACEALGARSRKDAPPE